MGAIPKAVESARRFKGFDLSSTLRLRPEGRSAEGCRIKGLTSTDTSREHDEKFKGQRDEGFSIGNE